MKFSLALAVAVTVGMTVVSATESVVADKVEVSVKQEMNLYKNIRTLGKQLNKMKVGTLEKISDPMFLQTALALEQVDGSSNNARSLQFSETLEFFKLIKDECPDELDAVITIFPKKEDIAALVDCVKDLFVELLEQCLADIPGLLAPLECILELGVEADDVDVKDFSDSGFDLESIDDESDDDEDEDEDYDFSSDSAHDFEDKYEKVSGLKVGFNASAGDCPVMFGTAALPDFFACVSLIDAEQIEAFKQKLLNFEANSACTKFALIAGVKQSKDSGKKKDYFEAFFFEGIDLLDDFDLETCSQAVYESTIAKYNAAFAQCSQIDNGALEAELQSRFVSPAPITQISALTALILASVMLLL